MSNNSNDESVFAIIALSGIAIFAFIVWQFSGVIHVNMETGFFILLRLIIVLAICFALVKYDRVSLAAAIPGFVSGVVWAMLPALDYWSLQADGSAQFGFKLEESAWYAKWYLQFSFVLLPSLLGYSFRYVKSR